jgi:acyl-CoA synthetase (AMP-forming)/AMP-acid ligase II
MNLAALLAAVESPERPALIFSRAGGFSHRVTFTELNDLSARLAAGLRALGLREGDRAVVLAPISLYLYAGLIALFRLGAAAVFLDPQAGWQQLERAATLAQAKAFIGASKAMWLRWLSPALRHIPLRLLADGDGPRSLKHLAQTSPPRAELADVPPETPALITFTGGATDSAGPRGVLRTHGLLAAQHAAIARALPHQPGDVDLPAFPIVTLHNLAAGVTSVIPDFPFRRPQAVRPEIILSQIETFGVTTASGSPAYWDRIAEHCLARTVMLPLRRIITGGAPVSPQLMTRMSRIAPRAEVLGVYGGAEAEPVAVMPAAEVITNTAPLTANGAGIPLGCPISGVGVRILDSHGADLPAGEVGEIWVAGEHVAQAYFANPRADAENKCRDAEGRLWHRMSDMGYRDEQGRLWLAGRVNTVVTRGGQALYPVLVEAAVEALPFIRRAALVGRPDAAMGERAVLVVELGPERPADWLRQVRAKCAEHGWPIDELRAISRLPVDARHNARIDYERLRKRLYWNTTYAVGKRESGL